MMHRMIRITFIPLVFLVTASDVWAAPTLAEESKLPGVVETLTSTKADPVGVAGLPGLVGSFVVKAGCADAHRVVPRSRNTLSGWRK